MLSHYVWYPSLFSMVLACASPNLNSANGQQVEARRGILTLVVKPGSVERAGQDDEDEEEPQTNSLLGEPLFPIELGREQRITLEANLAAARAAYLADPSDVEHIIWYGRRLAYLWQYREAVEVFSKGIELHPRDARLYRHRGHRYITLREFRKATADLQRAAELITGTMDEVEPDGAPNAAGIPTSTLHTNIYYHLGLSWYLRGNFERALEAYEQCLEKSTNNDMRIATLDWQYMTLRRLGRHEDADALIQGIDADYEIIENFSYHRRILMYRGLIEPQELLGGDEDERSPLDLATQGYGVANWYLANGDRQKATEILREVLSGPHWSAFGYIAAEADFVRQIGQRRQE